MAISPAEPLGTVNITVTTPGGRSPISSADLFTYTKAVPAFLAKGSTFTNGNVSFSATLTPPATYLPPVGGSVSFAYGSQSLCTAVLTNGSGSCLLMPTFSPGTYTISASYSGDANYEAMTETFSFDYTYASTGSLSSYHPITPVRICDTRKGNPSDLSGVALSQCEGKILGPQKTLNVEVGGLGPVPPSATGVMVNITAVNPNGASYLTVYPDGTDRPATSSLSVSSPYATAKLQMVAVGKDGKISIYNATGYVNVVVDIQGYTTPDTNTQGAFYIPISPLRICDTRSGNPSGLSGGQAQCNGHGLQKGSVLNIQVAGIGSIPSHGVSGVILNTAITDTGGTGYATLYPAGIEHPMASNLNWILNDVVVNEAAVPLSQSGAIDLYSFTPAQAIVDVVGYYVNESLLPAGKPLTSLSPSSAGAFSLGEPVRVCDTRKGNPSQLSGMILSQCEGKTLGPQKTLTIQVTGVSGLPANSKIIGAVLDVTTIGMTSSGGYLTVYPGGALPVSSTIDWNEPAKPVSNMAITGVGPNGTVSIYNSSGYTNVVVDVVGYIIR
jgi:hypothetical protein